METYRATYYWTQEELIRAMRHHRQSSLRPRIVQTINIFSVLLAALAVFVLFVEGLEPSAVITASLFVGFAIYWLFLHRKVGNWWLGRGFDKRFGDKVLMEWEFSSETVKCHCENLSFSEAEWKIFGKIAEANDGFLLYSHNIFHWLPFSAFEKAEGIAQVRQFAKDSGVKYVRLAGWAGTLIA